MKIRELLTTWIFDVDFKKLDKMDKKIGELRDQSSKFGKNLKQLAGDARDTGARFTGFLTLPIAALGITTLRAAGNFEAGMNRVSALTQATGEQFQRLEDLAKDLGATTQFSARETADAMGFLAQAGLDTEKIIGALPDALKLAGAAQIDFATTADIVTNVMSGMGIETKDLGSVVDVLTKAFISSNTDLTQLGEAMKFAGPIAKGFGLSLNDTVSILGLMGNAGIQASMAGTSLRGALTRLANPTRDITEVLESLGVNVNDSAGQTRNLVDILTDLEKAGINTAQSMTVFGQRAGPAMVTLLAGGVNKIKDFSKELDKSGGIADEIQRKQLKGLNGAIKALTSAWEGLQIAVGESGLLDFFTDVAKAITKFIRWVGKLNKGVLITIAIFGFFVAAIGPILFLLGSFGFAAIGLSQALITLRAAIVATRLAMVTLNASFLLIPAAILLGIALVGLFVDELIGFGAGNKSVIGDVIKGWGGFGKLFNDIIESAIFWLNKLWVLSTAAGQGIVDAFVVVGDEVSLAIETVILKISGFFDTIGEKFKGLKKISGFFGKVFGDTFSNLFGDAKVTPQTIIQSGESQIPILPPISGGNKTSKNTVNNINPTINMTVPAGSTAEQQRTMAESMKRAAEEVFGKEVRKLNNEFPEVG